MTKRKRILITSLLLIAAFIVLGIFSMARTSMIDDEIAATFNDIGKTLEKAGEEASQRKQKENKAAISKVQKHILTTVENNKNLIASYNIPKKYLNVYIHKDGVYIKEITLKQWMIYVLATNKSLDMEIEWINNIAKVEQVYKYSDIPDQGIRFKFPGVQSSFIFFIEEDGELYPSYHSVQGGSLSNLSTFPILKEEALRVLTALTDIYNLDEQG